MSKPLFSMKWENTLGDGIKEFAKKNKNWRKEASIQTGKQLLNFILNTSPVLNLTPPILTGYLRGSASVFFENEKIKESNKVNGQGNPNSSYNAGKDTIAVGFNTAYAARWHEKEFNPGEFSRRSGNVGHKYVEKHLQSDKDLLMKTYANIIKRYM